MSWWKKLFGGGNEDSSPDSGNNGSQTESEQSKPEWLSADDPGNPFPVPILNLMSNLQTLAVSEDPECAERSISWRPGQPERLEWTLNGKIVDCELRYRVADEFPEGMLFTPSAMEDKWVVAFKDNKIALARSWTGTTEVVADCEVQNNQLVVHRLHCSSDTSMLESFGPLVETFDWLLKTHALETKLPLPVDTAGAELLESVPLSGMSPYGHRLFCAAIDYEVPAVEKPLRSSGSLALAIQDQDLGLVQTLLATESPNAPTSFDGFRPLHLAVIKKNQAIIDALLTGGADIQLTADRERGVLPLAVVQNCGTEILEQLLSAGASLDSCDQNGFGPLHAAAEVDAGKAAQFLIERGADLEAKTNRGFTPLHIACALGSLQVVKVLVKAGADRSAESNSGVPIDVARAEGKNEVVEWLEQQ